MILGFFALGFMLLVLLVYGLLWTLVGAWNVGEWLVALIREHQRTRQAQIETEVERAERDLHVAVLQLTEALGVEAHEVRRQLIRESFRAQQQASGTSSHPS